MFPGSSQIWEDVLTSFLQPFTGEPGKDVSWEQNEYILAEHSDMGGVPRGGPLCMLQAISSILLVINLWQRNRIQKLK